MNGTAYAGKFVGVHVTLGVTLCPCACPQQLLKLKSAYDELEEALEASKRENRHLQGGWLW